MDRSSRQCPQSCIRSVTAHYGEHIAKAAHTLHGNKMTRGSNCQLYIFWERVETLQCLSFNALFQLSVESCCIALQSVRTSEQDRQYLLPLRGSRVSFTYSVVRSK